MNRSRMRTVTTAAALATAPLLAGCQPPPKPAPPPPPPPKLTVPQERSADVDGFRDALAKVDQQLQVLPGRTEDEHRQAAATALAQLTTALRMAYGPDPAPGFATDVSVVDAAAHTLADPEVPQLRLEAAENQALDATVAALRKVAARVLYDDPDLPPAIDAAAARLDPAHMTSGPLHDGDVTDALRALDTPLHRVGDDLRERFAPASSPLPTAVAMPAAPTTLPMMGPGATSTPATLP